MKTVYLLEVGIELTKTNPEFDLYLHTFQYKEKEQKELLSLYNTNVIVFIDKDKREDYAKKYLQETKNEKAYAMCWEQEITDEDYQKGKKEIEKYGYTAWVDIDFNLPLSSLKRKH